MPDSILLELDSVSKIGLAVQQNGVPVLRAVRIVNHGTEPIRDAKLVLASDPEFFPPVPVLVSQVLPGETAEVRAFTLCPSHAFLSTMTERTAGALKASLYLANDAAPFAEAAKPIDLCAHDEWFGAGFMPELLAAFSTPNADETALLLKRTSELLVERSGNGALDGYQRADKSRALLVAKCVYDAVLERAIHYAEPPAGFGESGQRVRFPRQILAQGFATCLDFSLLMAGMLEQAGLHPVLMLQKRHAFLAVHLLDYRFPDAVNDDLQTIRKRVDLDEIAVFEPTAAADGQSKFSVASAQGAKHLLEDDDFLYALDVAQARAIGVRPLAGVAGLPAPAEIAPGAAIDSDEPLRDLASAPSECEREAEATDVPARVVRWRSKLLDLSRRNRLLNFRDSKQSIQIVGPQTDALENALNDGAEFSLNPRPEIFDTAKRDPRDAATLEQQTGDDPVRKYLDGEFASKRLRTMLEAKELDKRLTGLYRQARTDVEDGGVNTLFLGVGFLRWLDGSGAGASTYQAPLVLVPVRLDRQSARSGYTLARTDEDAVVNVTLLEMLRREFGCAIPQLDPPPEDDAGLDVAAVIRIFREAIRDLKGWEVLDALWLGRFYFSKFIMWDDLNKRLDDLCASPIVGHLIRGSGTFSDGVETVRPDEVDTCIAPEELLCPASADSSQLAAVIAATRGKNFVLHGPPGTGKSQTIMNLVAFALAQGKTVLFVAEKRAALEVVQRRLAKLGLGPFCLELHSNKSGKSDVLAQFAEAVAFNDGHEPREWSVAAADLAKTRAALTDYVRALHKTYPCGLTPYRAFSYLFAHEQDETAMRDVGALGAASFAAGELDAMLEAGRELAGQAQEIPPQLFDALLFARPTTWSPSWEEEAVEAAQRLREAADSMSTAKAAFNAVAGLAADAPLAMAQLAAAVQLGEALQTLPRLPEGFCAGDWDVFSKTIAALAAAGEKANESAARLQGFDLDAVAAFDVEAMRQELAETRERFIITRMIRNGRARKTLAACLQPGARRKIAKTGMPELLDDFERYTAQRRIVEGAASETTVRMAGVFEGLSTHWAAVRALCAAVEGLQPRLRVVAGGGVETLPAMRRALGAYGASADRSAAQAALRALAEAWTRFAMAAGTFETTVAGRTVEADDAAATCAARADAVMAHARHLRRWCIWNGARATAVKAGIQTMVNAVESGALAAGDVQAAIRKRYDERFIAHVVDAVPEIRNFLGNSHDGLVAKYSALDDQIEKLAQQVTLARLAARLPSGRGGDCPAGSELGILKRECAKKSRHKPVRKLLESIPTLLPVLKPCLLMSPLSVAQYLPPGSNNFDIVVFDEASQITVWDAIGAMARGKQVVVVGDPKQLPPTTFFQRQAEEETTDDSDIEELESILDECRATGVADLHLLWHYRSRHESLIAFSNRNYYHDSLQTFPSALRETTRFGVSFVHVPDGVYDRSRTRTNPLEAERLVTEVVARLLDPAMAKKSTGVVTFSEAQQTLIEDLMDEARREHPEIEPFFASDAPEPFFVKNLESVQGDERDAIYFSICYGPDREGNFAMNFGPLNRPGGERRLNVAVTRAKEQVVVFSSVVSTQIDTGRTQATGAMHLRSFLEYAERGNLQGTSAATASAGTEGNLFEDEVAEFLRCHGYDVDRDVGCSGCRVAIAVRGKADPAKYAIGVDCDGELYAATASARDRDKLRAMVLTGLGWRLVRVWSAAWWFDREATQRKLLGDVDAAVNGLQPPSAGTHRFEPVAAPPEPTMAFQVQKPSEWEKVFEPGEFVDGYAKSQSNFNLQFGPQIIGEQMRRIVNAEGPIVESLLRARVLKEWGFARSGSMKAKVLERSVPKALPTTTQFGERVFWPEGADPSNYRFYRVPGKDEAARRGIDEIPVEELRNAMAAVLEQFGAVPQDSLYVETARRFGFARVSPSARKRYDEAHGRLES